MSIFSAHDVAEELHPVLDSAVKEAVDDAAKTLVPALQAALQNALDGLSVTITVAVTKKPAKN